MHGRSLHGNREISRLTASSIGAVRIGKAGGPKPMMHGREKSDPAIVAMKPANAAGASRRRSRWSEGPGPRGTRIRTARPGHRAGTSVSPALDRVRQAARERKKEKFTALLHHVDVDLLRWSYLQLEAGGGGRRGWGDVGGLRRGPGGASFADLHAAVHRGATGRSRRGGLHPQAGRPATAARRSRRWRTRSSSGRVVEVLNAIYETDFLGFSLRVPAGAQPA